MRGDGRCAGHQGGLLEMMVRGGRQADSRGRRIWRQRAPLGHQSQQAATRCPGRGIVPLRFPGPGAAALLPGRQLFK